MNGGSATIGNSDIADLAWGKLTSVPNLVTNGGNASSLVANNTGSKPAGQVAGRIYVDVSNQKISYDNGTAWVDVSGSASAAPSASVAAPLTSTSGTIGIPQATGSADGFLSSADWTSFTAKLGKALTSAHLFVGSGSGQATDVAVSGDVSLANTGAFTVNAIRGTAVSAVPSTAGQVLRYDGTDYTPAFTRMADLRSTVTGTSAITGNCTASQTLTWNSGTDSLQCQNISIAASSQISGVLPIANGGTGTNSAGQNLVFAGPSSGAGAPAFRALAAGDLPAEAKLWTESSGNINRASGYVGIGIASPTAKLHVVGTDNETLRVESSNTMSTTIELINSSAGAHTYQFYTSGSGNGSGPGLFGVYDATANRTPLSISGATNLITTNAIGGFGWSAAPVYADSAADTLLSRAAPGVIEINNGTAGSTRDLKVRALNPSGANLGIGLTSATDKLSIGAIAYGNNQDGGIRLQSPAGEWVGRFAMKSDAGGSARMAIEAPANPVGGSNEAISIKVGKVGLGTTNPTVALDIGSHTDAIRLPAGTAAQQPGQASMPAAANGMIRYNTTSNSLEAYVNGAWTNLATVGGTQSFAGDVSVGGTFTSAGAATFNGGVTIAGGALTMSGQNITGVGSNITGSGALTVAAGGGNTNLTLNSSGAGAVNVGSGNGTSLSVLDGGASTANYITVKGAAAGATPVIGTAGSDTNVDLTFSPKGTGRTIFSSGNIGVGTTAPTSAFDIFSSSGAPEARIRTTAAYPATLRLDRPSGQAARYITSTSLSSRWEMHLGDSTAETGSNAGSDFKLLRQDDSGGALGAAFFVKRSSGAVGIGTTSPYSPLHVMYPYAKTDTTLRPALTVSSNEAANPFKIYVGMTGAAALANRLALIQTGDDGISNGGSLALQPYAGYVGIGTSVPTTTLHVQGAQNIFSGSATSATGLNLGRTAGEAAFGLAANGADWSYAAASGDAVLRSTSGKLILSALSNTGSISFTTGNPDSAKMTVLNNGMIGIGTTTPTGSLHILHRQAGNADGIVVENDVTTNPNQDGPYLTFQYDEKVASPVESGDYIGGIRFRSSYLTDTYSGVAASIKAFQDGTVSGTSSPGALQFSTTADGTTTLLERMRITNTGNVGIGTTMPGDPLDVNGFIRAKGIRSRTGYSGAAGNNYFNFNWTGSVAQLWVDATNVGNITVSSDRRLKKDIQTLDKTEGLDALAKLRPVSFHWRLPEDDPSKQLGFIAQEVETVFPNLVKTGMKTELAPDGIRRVEHIGLIAPIVKAIQEVREWMLGTDARVKALEAQNEAKARELAQVKAKNDALTAYLCEKDPRAPFCAKK